MRKFAAITTAAAALLLLTPMNRAPLVERGYGSDKAVSQISEVISSTRAGKAAVSRADSLVDTLSRQSDSLSPHTNPIKKLDSSILRKVEASDLRSSVVVLLEHHGNASNRLAFAQLMRQRPDGKYFSEFFEPSWQDSVNAYLLQRSDTLPSWLNQKLFSMSYDRGVVEGKKLSLIDNHSYGKLLFAARQSRCELKGVCIYYRDINTERTVWNQDSLYSLKFADLITSGERTSFILIGAAHFGLKARLQKTSSIAGNVGVSSSTNFVSNVLLWDSNLGPAQTEQIGMEDFEVNLNNEVFKPLIGLNLPPGIYQLVPGSDYAARYGIDYIWIVDTALDMPMPPLRKQ